MGQVDPLLGQSNFFLIFRLHTAFVASVLLCVTKSFMLVVAYKLLNLEPNPVILAFGSIAPMAIPYGYHKIDRY